MLYTPSTGFSSKRGRFGIVTTRNQAGHTIRAYTLPINARSPQQVNWRATFLLSLIHI